MKMSFEKPCFGAVSYPVPGEDIMEAALVTAWDPVVLADSPEAAVVQAVAVEPAEAGKI